MEPVSNLPDEARDAAAQTDSNPTPTLLILDVMLPGMTGLEICQTLRATGVQIPILMLSALGALEDRVAGLRLGADDYLAKPFLKKDLRKSKFYFYDLTAKKNYIIKFFFVYNFFRKFFYFY